MSLPAQAAGVPPSKTPSQSRGWVLRLQRYGLFLAVCALVVVGAFLEAGGSLCQQQSRDDIAQWARAQTPETRISLASVETKLRGFPRRKFIVKDGARRAIYTWPTLVGVYRLRALVRRDDTVVYLDLEPDESEDFMAPFLVANEDGVRVPQPGDPHPAEIQGHVVQALLDRTNQQFAGPPPRLAPGCVIFPFTDDQSRIVAAGTAISSTVQQTICCTSRKYMALDPRLVRRVLMNAECWAEGTLIDEALHQRCLRLLDVKASCTGIMRKTSTGVSVTLRYHPGGAAAPQTLEIEGVDSGDLAMKVGTQLFNVLGIELTAEEQQRANIRQIESDAAAEAFARLSYRSTLENVGTGDFFDALLTSNSQWVAAWDMYVDFESPLQRFNFRTFQPESVEVKSTATIARNLIESSNIRKRFERLLELTPQLRGEPLFYQGLVRVAREMHQDELVEDLFRIWRLDDNRQPSRIARAQEYLGWASDARGINSWQMLPPSVQQTCDERIEQARQELEAALEKDPENMEAHAEMIRVLSPRNRSPEGTLKHFEAAIRHAPSLENAWTYRGRTTFGTHYKGHREEWYRYIDQCLQSRLWKLQLPQSVPELLREINFNTEDQSLDYAELQTPEYWQRLEAFLSLARQHPDPHVHRFAIANVAHDGALSGRYQDVAKLFEELDKLVNGTHWGQGNEEALPRGISVMRMNPFGSEARFIDLRDRVRATTGTSTADKLSAARVALIEHRIGPAIEILNALGDGLETADGHERDRLQRAAALAERLQKERTVTLSGEQLLQILAEPHVRGYRGLDLNPRWQAIENRVICRFEGNANQPDPITSNAAYFPIGMEKATITVDLMYEGDLQNIEQVVRSGTVYEPVYARYHNGSGVIDLRRHGWATLERSDLPSSQLNIRLEFGSNSDAISLGPDHQWKVAAVPPVPAGWGLQISWNARHSAVVTIANVTISLND